MARTPHERTWALDPVLDFMRRLWATEHALETTSKRMAAHAGITGPQRLVLRIVERFPEISAGELAQLTWLHPSTLTGILRRLERKGLLDRRSDPDDRRRARLRVKPPARRLIRSAAGTVEAGITRLLRELPKTRIAHALEVLEALARVLEPRIADAENRATASRASRPRRRRRAR